MGSIPVRDSEFFFVPRSCHVDQFTFQILIVLTCKYCCNELASDGGPGLSIRTVTPFCQTLLVNSFRVADVFPLAALGEAYLLFRMTK